MSVSLRLLRSAISSMTAISVFLAQLPALSAQEQQTVSVSIEQCQNLSDPEVRAQIEALTREVLSQQLARIDYALLIDKYWREVKMSERLDSEIDEAIRIVRAGTSVIDRAYSTISKETAEKTATAVAERTYGSEGFKAALSDLAQGVGKDFGTRLESAASLISGPVIRCVRTALQSRYGSAIAQVFERETESQRDVVARSGGTTISTGDLLLENVGTISGITLIVSRRIIARMIASIGRRVAGLVATRIISTFAGLIGLVLIARDLYEASEGVFPLIEERMKSDEAKDLIKVELAKSIENDLQQQIASIASETTERIYAFWQDFKQKYDVLLGLAEKNVEFSAFLKTRRADELGRLGRIVSFLLNGEGESGVLQRTRDGTLRNALSALDDTGVALAVEINSLENALKWSERAGARLPKAVAYGIPQILSPQDITADQLSSLLSLGNKTMAQRIARLDKPARDGLLGLPFMTMQDLARRLSENELSALATYIQRLQKPAANRILRDVAANPGLMKSLSSHSLQDAIITSRDQLSAIEMLLRDNSALNISNISNDFTRIMEGDVNFRVFMERYWAGLLLVCFLGALLLLTLRRILFGRPATVIIKSADGGGKK